jgi:large subunit ribosomal protein L19
MSKILDKFNKEQTKQMPDIKPGDSVKVHQKVKEGNKDRIQIFEGVVIARKHGKGISATITVRKVVEGVGVERVFPVYSPAIDKIEVVKRSKVRRAKLYYLRTAKGKKARLKNKEFSVAIAEEKPETAESTEEQAPAAEQTEQPTESDKQEEAK